MRVPTRAHSPPPMLTDLRYALRSLSRAPGFVFAAVVCLGLGLGANTTVYSLVNAMLLRPLPYAGAERLVGVTLSKPTQGWTGNALSVPYALDLKARSRQLAGLVACTSAPLHARRTGGPGGGRRRAGDGGLLRGVRRDAAARPRLPHRGGHGRRAARRGARRDAVAHALRRRRARRRPRRLARRRAGDDRRRDAGACRADGRPRAAVGAARPRAATQPRGLYYVNVVGRLRDGATVDGAGREPRRSARGSAAEHPETDRDGCRA